MDAFAPCVSTTLNNLGNMLRDLGERAEARQAYEEALGILLPYVKEEPRAFAERLAMVVGNAVKLLKETGEKPEEWPPLVEAVGVLAELKEGKEEGG